MFGISNLSPADVDGLTYREIWTRYYLPALRHQRDRGDKPAAKESLDQGEQKAFVDALCGGKKYDGEMWWLDHLRQSEEKKNGKV